MLQAGAVEHRDVAARIADEPGGLQGEITLPMLLGDAGYTTQAVGKWHLGGKGHQPTDHGFDEYFAGRANAGAESPQGGKGELGQADYAVKFIQKNKANPFLLYLAFDNPHIPLAAPVKAIEANAKSFHPTYAALIESLRTNPGSRRHIFTGWNVADLDRMALMPCHALFQFYVADGKLSCQLYQRSADIFLGVPFNIASYALLTHMVAQQCDLDVGDFIWTGGDCHIYDNHREQVELQLSRQPFAYPTLNIKRRPDSIFDYQYEDFEVVGYECHPAIKAPVAV